MALEGSIRDFGLPDIIQFIQQQNKSGVLTIEGAGRWSKILFEEGKIVFAYTPESETPAGIAQELIDAEWLPEVKVRSVLIGNPGWEAFENSLVGPSGLSPDLLGQFFILHTTEILYRLFQLREGKYRFDPSGGIQKPRHASAMDSDFILLEGMRQFDEWPMLRRQIPSGRVIFDKIPEKINLVRVSDEESGDAGEASGETPGAIGISETEMEIYEKIDGHRDVAKLVALSKKGEFETVKALGNMLGKELIVQAGESQAEEAEQAGLPEPGLPAAKAVPRKRSGMGSYPYVGTAVVVAILAGWTVIYAPGLKESLEGSRDYRDVIKADVIGVDKKKVQEAILVFYLRNQRMPVSAKELSAQIEESGPAIKTLERNGIPIETFLKRGNP